MSKVPKVRRDGPYEIHGHYWVRDDAGTWRQYVIRKLTRAGQYQFSEVFYVDATEPVCLACLSQNVLVHDDALESLECNHCGAFYYILYDDDST